jgi:hypothetical protein
MIKPQYSAIGRIRQLVIFHPSTLIPECPITDKPDCLAFDKIKSQYSELLKWFSHTEVYLLVTYATLDPDWLYYKVPFTNLHMIAVNAINQRDPNLSPWTQDEFHVVSSQYGGIPQTFIYFSDAEVRKQGMLRLVNYIAREPKQCLLRQVNEKFNAGDVLVGCYEGADYLLFGKSAKSVYDDDRIRQIYKARYGFYAGLACDSQWADLYLYHVDLYMTIIGQQYNALGNKELILLAEPGDAYGNSNDFPEDVRNALDELETWLKQKEKHLPVEFEVVRIPMPVVNCGGQVFPVSYNNGIVENYVDEGHHITKLYLPKYSSNSELSTANLAKVEIDIANKLADRNIMVMFVENEFFNLIRDRRGSLHCRIKPVMRSIC